VKAEKESLTRELEAGRAEIEKLNGQTAALRVDKDSLTCELQAARQEVAELRNKEDILNGKIVGLESDLAGVVTELRERAAQGKISVYKEPADESVEPVAVEEPCEPVAQSASVAAPEPLERATQTAAVVCEAPVAVPVTREEAEAATFDDEAQKAIFIRALSDIGSPNADARADAARAMTGVHHVLSVRALAVQMSHEPSAQVRQEYIKTFVALAMVEAVPAIERALADPVAAVRLAAVRAIYRLLGAASGEALVPMLCDPDQDVRRRASSCIGWLGRKDLAAKLVGVLTDDTVAVRRSAIEALANLRCDEILGDLIARLNEPEESLRPVVLSALEAITGKKMSTEPFPSDDASLERFMARWHEWWKAEQDV